MYCSHILIPHGYVFVYAMDQGVVKVEIPDLSRSEKVYRDEPQEFESSEITLRAAGLLQRYFHGEQVDFADIPVVLDGMPPFRQKVLTAIRALSFGEIRSYSQVAELCGSPHAARAVGGALASNPIPIIIPCHRVVASDGRLTGFSAPGGENTKEALLKMEHVEFKGMLAVVPEVVMHRRDAR